MAKEFLYEKANQVMGAIPPATDGSKGIAIELILAILQMLPTLYQCFKDHKKAAARVQSPSFFDKLILRRAVRQKLGTDAFRKHGGDVMKGIMSLGENATEADIAKYLADVKG